MRWNRIKSLGGLRGKLTLSILVLGVFPLVAGMVIAYLVAAGSDSRINHLLSTQAFYVTQAGMEYGV
ncbi:MAG: hypothetical protein HZA19_02845, partial [Nitrospirae bacterium]|nr:hypothetical protein [Nitrospirota bacterium]